MHDVVMYIGDVYDDPLYCTDTVTYRLSTIVPSSKRFVRAGRGPWSGEPGARRGRHAHGMGCVGRAAGADHWCGAVTLRGAPGKGNFTRVRCRDK